MAANPPFRQRPRARPGSLDKPVNGRMYRGTWLLVGIPLLIAAFAVGQASFPHNPVLQPDFDGQAAAFAADDFTGKHPDRTPGSQGAAGAADWVADRLAQYGLRTERERFHAKIPGRGRVALENLVAVRHGRSNQVIVVVAHRDNSGAGPGTNDNGSGTAALLELARSYATLPSEPNNTIVFLSSDGGAFGGLGAREFAAHSPYRRRIVAVLNLDALSGAGPPRAVFNGNRRRLASPNLVRAAADRVVEQTGVELARPSGLAQLLDLAFPFSLYEQAPFVDRGIAAITLTSAGDRPPSSFGDNPDRDHPRRLETLGRSAQALLSALNDQVELAEGTSTYIYLGSRVIRGWAIVLVLCAAMLPALAVIVDLFARLRRRHIPLGPALRSYRSRIAFWLLALVLFELFAVIGVWDTGAPVPLAPELSPGTRWPVAGLALFGALLAVAWFVARDRLLPRRPPSEEEVLAGQVGALLVLAVVSLLLVATNPYSVLFVLPSLHAWIWLPQFRNRPWPARALLLLVGFAGPALLIGSFATRLDLGFDAPWYLAELAAVRFIPFTSLLIFCAWLAVAAQLSAIVAGRYAPYPSAAERPRLGPGRRLVRHTVLAARRQRPAEQERDREVGP